MSKNNIKVIIPSVIKFYDATKFVYIERMSAKESTTFTDFYGDYTQAMSTLSECEVFIKKLIETYFGAEKPIQSKFSTLYLYYPERYLSPIERYYFLNILNNVDGGIDTWSNIYVVTNCTILLQALEGAAIIEGSKSHKTIPIGWTRKSLEYVFFKPQSEFSVDIEDKLKIFYYLLERFKTEQLTNSEKTNFTNIQVELTAISEELSLLVGREMRQAQRQMEINC